MCKKGLSIISSIIVILCLSGFFIISKEPNYKVVTSDIDNFWNAYNKLEPGKDSIRIFQEFYIDKASPEFQEFLKVRNFTAEEYVQSVKAMPKFWKSVRPMTEQVKARQSELISFFEQMKNTYPVFKQPDICFAIGPIRTGGTTTPGLILIGTEIAAADTTVDLSEFAKDNFFRNFIGNTGDIIGMVAHETIHTQQPANSDMEDKSLLKRAILEGGADFLGSLILGKQIMTSSRYEYGIKYESELWKEFQKDMSAGKTFDQTDWFYKYQGKKQPDLGYFIGYRICESYYNNAKDKKEAIKEIIELNDANTFLQKSKYKAKFGS